MGLKKFVYNWLRGDVPDNVARPTGLASQGWNPQGGVLQIEVASNGHLIRYAAGQGAIGRLHVVESGGDLGAHLLAVLVEMKLTDR